MRILQPLSLGLVLALSTVFVPSIGFYAGNAEGFDISPWRLSLYLTLLSAGLAIATGLLLSLPNRQGRIFAVLAGLVNGLAVMALIQGTFLLWNFGPLDGRGLPWANWRTEAWVELAAWLVVPAVVIFIGIKHTRATAGITRLLIVICIGFVLASLLSNNFDSTKSVETGPAQTPFIFHAKHNTLLIVLDELQSDVFQEILENHPAELNFLTDFTYYPNTVGGYPTTRVSIPLILTGKYYQNEGPIDEWFTNEVANQTIINHYERKGFGAAAVVNGTSSQEVGHTAVSMRRIKSHGWRSELVKFLPVVDAGIFRCAPTLLKPLIYEEGNWFVSRMLDDSKLDPPGHHGADSQFVRAMQANISLESTKSGEFKYYHLRGAHEPVQVDENFHFRPNMSQTRESFVLQTRGVFKNVRNMLDALKSKSIYDSAEILIVGDHGSLVFPAADLHDGDALLPEAVYSASRPLFLYKPSSGKGDNLRLSDAPLHLGDASCILSAGEGFCEDEITSVDDLLAKRPRRFFYYQWGHEYWTKTTMPPMTHYIVSGDVRDPDSWALAPESAATVK